MKWRAAQLLCDFLKIISLHHFQEKDLEMELGDDYILDLQSKKPSPSANWQKLQADVCTADVVVFAFKEYWDLMNEDEKHDKIPEVWEGHNIADYIDPDIMKVSFCVLLHGVQWL